SSSGPRILNFQIIRVTAGTVAALQAAGFVNATGFDSDWPQQLPLLGGSAGYVVMNGPLPNPGTNWRDLLDLFHSYYDAHRSELIEEAQARNSQSVPT